MSSILKRIEKSLRIPLYTIAKLFVTKRDATLPLDGNRMQRILLIRDDRIGDMVVTLPSLKFLKDTFPHLDIDVLCSPSNNSVLQENPHIHKAYILPKNKIRRLIFLRSLRKNDYDCIIPLVFLKKSRYGFFSQIIQTPKTITVVFEKNVKELYRSFFSILTSIPFGPYTMTEMIQRWFCLIFGIEFNSSYNILPFGIPEQSRSIANNFLIQNQIIKPIIIYNISASETIRQLDQQTHKEVIEQLLMQTPQFQIVILYIQKDKKTVTLLKNEFKNQVKVFEPTSVLFDIIALIERSSIVISPNTAITHITATLDKPLLSIQSYQTSIDWRPKHSKYRLLSAKKTQEVNTITAEEVIQEFSKLIEEHCSK
jgi:ADP-heptose:LPS heptosyltransferase